MRRVSKCVSASHLAALSLIVSLPSCSGFYQIRDVSWLGDDERVVVGEIVVGSSVATGGTLFFSDQEDFGNRLRKSPLKGFASEVLEFGGIFSVGANAQPFYLVSTGPDASQSATRGKAITRDSVVINLEIPAKRARCEYVGTLRIHGEHVELFDNFEFGRGRLARSVENCSLTPNLGRLVENPP